MPLDHNDALFSHPDDHEPFVRADVPDDYRTHGDALFLEPGGRSAQDHRNDGGNAIG